MSGERIKKKQIFVCPHALFSQPSHIYALRIIYINNNLLLPIYSMYTTGLNCHHLYEATYHHILHYSLFFVTTQSSRTPGSNSGYWVRNFSCTMMMMI